MPSLFRHWLEDFLRPLTGRPVEWPYLYRCIFEEELVRIRDNEEHYQGPDVFINRDQTALDYQMRPDQHREDLSVYRLFRRVHQEGSGCLIIDGEQIWLITCKTPNQGNHGVRAADLLGLRTDGSLVVFECKIGNNRSDSPLHAILEGLDYLGHLLIGANLERLQNGLDDWRASHDGGHTYTRTPTEFEDVTIKQDAKHGVIVMAPTDYFDTHRLSSAGVEEDWCYLSDRYWNHLPTAVRLEFVQNGFPPDEEALGVGVLLPLPVPTLGRH